MLDMMQIYCPNRCKGSASSDRRLDAAAQLRPLFIPHFFSFIFVGATETNTYSPPNHTMTSTGAQLVFLRDSEDGILDDIYATFFSKIKDQVSTVDVDFTTTKDIFKDITLQIVLVVGGELTKKLYSGLHSQLARFAKDGGAVICCCNVSSFCLPGDLKDFFGTFGLQWTSGDYHRTDHVLNEAFKLTFGASAFAELKPTYSQKALHLNHVPFNCRIYGPTSDSRTQSRVFPPMAVNHSQSSAVLGTCGKGYVGYVGDVNNEEGSQILLMALIRRFFASK